MRPALRCWRARRWCRAVMAAARLNAHPVEANDNAAMAWPDHTAGGACALRALLDDPLTRLVMRADNVSETLLLDLVCAIRVARAGLSARG